MDKMKVEDLKARKEALEAILEAITMTRKYIAILPEGFSREQELELARYWGKAEICCSLSIDMERPFNEACDKAVYWASELKMTKEELVEKGLDLNSVEKNYHILLREINSITNASSKRTLKE
ncbi:hypothetical protein [Pseudoalteromonas shioyasakiensis]|uniref:hypothetical protein n=1 Tax=Pseudoalteromonas shioyasakiensis TaxID=1190813 RepID=UPI002551F436|nr:hypothetical protein [Pseudoalteromonas shioyasakiensis]MDK9685476.1 hypothetical protein [Pseudoalteromonas shioyasakiensis]